MSNDHFYTTSLAERNNAVANLGYLAEGTACLVLAAPPPGPVPFYRFWSGGATDHFYTASFTEGANANNNLGYSAEGIAGYLSATQDAGTVPLFRMYSGAGTDHFYTTNAAERDNAVQHLGFSDEGIAGYVRTGAAPGYTPLYRAYSGNAVDHFYTTNAAERDNAVKNLGYADEGVACWIATDPPAGQRPLYRAYRPASNDHFYTMDIGELNNATNKLGYRAEGIAAYTYPDEAVGRFALRRAFQPATGDHFYTTSYPELQNAVANLGYKDEGVAAYVPATKIAGAVPFYRAVQGRQWSYLAHAPTFNVSTMLLLTDGSVMCQDGGSNNWWKLVPDAFGSYVNGTWQQLASMHQTRRYYASAVLADGRVFVAGGEYSDAGGDTNTAEIYDPTTNAWTVIQAPTNTAVMPPVAWNQIGDAPCAVLANGHVLMGSIGTQQTAIYDPTANSWTLTGNKGSVSSEETWTLLRDGSVLTADCANHPHAERYVPGTNTWSAAGQCVNDLVQAGSIEIGPAVLLPDGTVFAMGATGRTGIYTPPTGAAPQGTWAAGPDFPVDANNLRFEAKDAPGVLQPNGRVLVAAGPNSDANTGGYPTPTHLYEYDGDTLYQVADPSNAGGVPYNTRMMLLPTGEVLFANESTTVAVFTPHGGPDPSWAPTITNVPDPLTTGTDVVIHGRQFNGLSQAVSYGDDCASATNYPIARLRNVASGRVHYARTSKHSTMAVATGAADVSTTMHVPVMEDGPADLQVIANGIASAPVRVQVIAGPVTEDLIPINWNNVVAQWTGTSWRVTDGKSSILDFGTNQAGAVLAAQLIRAYRFDQQGFVGRPAPADKLMMYFLVGGQSPVGPQPGEDAIPFNFDSVTTQYNNGWCVVASGSILLNFGANYTAALTAERVILKHGFRYQCFVARPHAPMMYFRK